MRRTKMEENVERIQIECCVDSFLAQKFAIENYNLVMFEDDSYEAYTVHKVDVKALTKYTEENRELLIENLLAGKPCEIKIKFSKNKPKRGNKTRFGGISWSRGVCAYLGVEYLFKNGHSGFAHHGCKIKLKEQTLGSPMMTYINRNSVELFERVIKNL
jgi:hypothetical protein